MPLGKAPKKLDAESLKAYAVKLLAGRGLSTAELKQKLRRRAAEAADVESVVAQLKEYGYVNDARYAEYFASSKAGSGQFGQHRVLSDLRRKRVAGQVAEKAVARAFEDVDETAAVEQFLARKFKGKDLSAFLKDPKNLAAAYRRLRTAGFGAPASVRALKRHAARAEELEAWEEGRDS